MGSSVDDFAELPAVAAWRHGNLRTGFEATSFSRSLGRRLAVGATAATEAGTAWWVSYRMELTSSFVTRRVTVSATTGTGAVRSARLDGDGIGNWTINDQPAPQLAGCIDVDLESSVMTNAIPMRRLSLAIGQSASAPAVYVRVSELSVQRLEQEYVRVGDTAGGPAFDYEAPAFDFGCRIDYDHSCLVLNYPGIAERVE